MSYSLNGPSSAAEVECHISNVRLGLMSHAVLRDLFEIEDLGGEIPQGDNKSYRDFIDELSDEAKMMCARRRYYPIATLYDVLKKEGFDSPDKLKKFLEDIVNTSIRKEERLVFVHKAVSFFRTLSKQCLINSEYPDTSIPQGVYDMVRNLEKSAI